LLLTHHALVQPIRQSTLRHGDLCGPCRLQLPQLHRQVRHDRNRAPHMARRRCNGRKPAPLLRLLLEEHEHSQYEIKRHSDKIQREGDVYKLCFRSDRQLVPATQVGGHRGDNRCAYRGTAAAHLLCLPYPQEEEGPQSRCLRTTGAGTFPGPGACTPNGISSL